MLFVIINIYWTSNNNVEFFMPLILFSKIFHKWHQNIVKSSKESLIEYILTDIKSECFTGGSTINTGLSDHEGR